MTTPNTVQGNRLPKWVWFIRCDRGLLGNLFGERRGLDIKLFAVVTDDNTVHQGITVDRLAVLLLFSDAAALLVGQFTFTNQRHEIPIVSVRQ